MSGEATLPPPVARVEAEGRTRRSLAAVLMTWSVVVVLVVGALTAGLRYGVLLPQARLLIEAQANGLRIGRFGILHIEGLGGDVWRHFTVRRLTIADQRGVWLEANRLDVTWSYLALFQRRLHIEDLQAANIRLVRRPTLSAPTGVDRGLPVAFRIDRIRSQVEMLPAFSGRRGVYRLEVNNLLAARVGGAASGRVRADSLTHAGDFVSAVFDIGQGRRMQLQAQAREAMGGAIAGGLGLPADRPFLLDANLSGTMSSGQFRVDSRSGDIRPLVASGSWTPERGSAAGTLLLSSSRLLEGLATRFGPSAAFTITGRRAQGGLYDLNGRVRSENLQLAAVGRADIGRRVTGPQGLALELSIGRMARLLTWPEMAGGRAAGRLTGTAEQWTFRGTAEIDQPSAIDFSLARISGPVTVSQRRGEIQVETQASGSGGRGRGILAALLGARPTAQVSATWMRDGRLLLRRVNAQGSGMSIIATGSRGILGDLSFRGTGRISNLSVARPGATGVLAGSWSASQPGGTAPWRFTFDARGERFASGMPELDRLLGAAPRLRAQGTYGGADLVIASSTLDGTAGEVSTRGTITGRGGLQLALDWRARGPFRAGPVEIAGDIRGGGNLSGTLLNPRADLTAQLAEVDLPLLPLRDARVTLSFLKGPQDIDGLIAVTANSQYGPARGNGVFRFRPGGVDLSNVDVDAGGIMAQGSVSLTRGRPSLADFAVTIRPGIILTSGAATGRAQITDSANGPTGRISLQANNAVFRGGLAVRFMSATAEGPLSRLDVRMSAQSLEEGLWRFGGTGVMADTPQGYDFNLNLAGRIRRADFTTREARVHIGPSGRTARLLVNLSSGGSADVDVRMADRGLVARAVLQGADLGMVNEDLAGRFNANISLTGQGSNLTGDLTAQLQDAYAAGSRDPSRIAADVRARLAGGQITLDATAQDNQGLRSQANLVLPAEAAADPFRIAIVRNRPMRGTFAAQGQVGPLWNLLMGGERSLTGVIDARGQLSGTLADPRATGDATISAGTFSHAPTGLRLTNLGFRATLENNAIQVADLAAGDGHDGRVTGAGRISLQRNGDSSFRLDLTRFRLMQNDIATVTSSGQATINRNAQGQVRLEGALVVDRADIAANPPTPSGVVPMEVEEINRPAKVGPIRSWEQTNPNALQIALDVSLRAPRRVFVEGRGLDLELAVDAHVRGTSAAPILTGTARVVRGDYDLAGRRFQFDTRGEIELSTRPEQIRLDLTAVRDDPSLTATIRITGTAARPRIELSSSPALPQDEVLARVLFGSSTANLSPYQAAQLASGLSSMAGGGGFDVIGNLRNLANLDRLSFGGTDLTGVTVSGGKYITDDVYIELTGGGREGPSVQVEWRVRRNLSIISRIAGQGDSRVSVRWRRDY